LEGDFNQSSNAGSSSGTTAHQSGESKQSQSSSFKSAWRTADGKLVDAEKPGTGNFSQSGGVTPWQTADEFNRLTDKKLTVLRLREFESNDPAPANAQNAALPDHGFVYYTSVKDLETHLTQLKNSGRLPILACVCAHWLRKISEHIERPANSATKLADEDHFVAVDDFRPAQKGTPSMVRFHNSNAGDIGVWLPVSNFYDGSR